MRRRHTVLFNPPVTYLLRDDFSDARGAGAVNGTPATPGPGTRDVAADTGSNLSINGDRLVASGAVNSSDPRMFLGSVIRVPGVIFAATLETPGSAITSGIYGWRSNNTGFPSDSIFFLAGSLVVIVNGINKTVGSWSTNTEYRVWIIARSLGHLYIIAGGAFTNPSLIFISGVGSFSPMLAGLSGGGSGAVISVDSMTIPAVVWLPTPLASDGFGSFFGDTDGLGHAEGVAGGIGSGGNGLAWAGSTWSVSGGKAIDTPVLGSDVVINGGFGTDTDWTKGSGWTIAAGMATGASTSADLTAAVAPLINGAWYQSIFTLAGFSAGTARMVIGAATNPTHGANGTFVETNRATSTDLAVRGASFTGTIDDVQVKQLTLADLFASILCSTADVLADVALTVVSGTQAGLVLNLDSTSSPANFIIAYHDGTNCKLEKCVAGTYTTVISAAATYSANAVLRVTKIGSAYRLYYNNALVGSGTISDAGIISNTRHGLFSTYSGNTLDNFVVYASGSGGEYNNLNRYAS